MNLRGIMANRPVGGFRIIYADCPWDFKNWSHKGAGRGASRHYRCVPTPELCRMPVEALAAPDSALFLWASDPLLEDALGVMFAWGFEYKTVAFTWVKRRESGAEHIGTGYYTRANPETCLLGTRGSPGRPLHGDVRQLLEAPVREHSRKPDEVYGRIERLYCGPYIELFARTERPGWQSWGNEVGKFAAQEAAA